MRGRFRARPRQRHAFAYRQLHPTAQRGFNRGLVDLAVALRRVAVANLEQRAGHMHGNEQRRPGHELLVIEIAGVNVRRIAADAAPRRRRRDPHAPEKRPQGNFNPRRKMPDHPLAVHADDA
jgi:hypothetical protein